jgi:hypothetical protein
VSAVLEELLERIRAEYLEMPGLRLTAVQVQRLCGLDASTCAALLDALVAVEFLRRDPDGHYIRRDASIMSRSSMQSDVRAGEDTGCRDVDPAAVADQRCDGR